MKKRIVVAGAGGFIGGHLVQKLLADGNIVRAVDIKPTNRWYQKHPQAENIVLDLKDKQNCVQALNGFEEVFNLAADMGGIGFIETQRAACMLSVLINTHLLMAAKEVGITRYFYSSSACVYNASKQTDPNNPGLKEADAYPAMPEDGYGWEKLFSERMCRHFREDYGLATRIARFHNVYGPFGTYDGGREKAPAALCRKIIASTANKIPKIEVWGDGEQTRSFTYIDDCITGILKIMYSDIEEPINLGSSEMVTINQLIDIIEKIAGYTVEKQYNFSAPKGVRGRNSDNTLIKAKLGWEPSTPLTVGLEQTFVWIKHQMESGKDYGIYNEE